MSTLILIDDDIASQETTPESEPKIMLCDTHQTELITSLHGHNDYQLQVFHILASIASRSMGTINVVRYRCPVCALQQFDWIPQAVMAVFDSPPPHPLEINPS